MYFRAKLLLVLFGCGLTSAFGTVYTFDASSDLSSNFAVNVFPGDANVQWRAGYGPSGIFDGSDGGFAHFNNYPQPDSMRFLTGPVFLNSFDLSSQYFGGGYGVSEASSAGNDYRLVLYDVSDTILFDQVMSVSALGAWGTVTLNVANVSTIRIFNGVLPSGANGGTGWWPNVDNIRVNEAAGVADSGSTIALLGLALCAIAGARRRRT
ncbi:MAG TPA: VPDSG-CTERM sorting domain-containing protein [Lacunisphaera sp.]|nr:VPDSG-CTERM sorting domain-containing protein [Lacunisphaera sp.]